MLTKSIVVNRPRGLEARPIAELVQVASKYESSVYLEHASRRVNAKSIMGMLSINLLDGQEIAVSAVGPDEKEALEEIRKFLTQDGLQ